MITDGLRVAHSGTSDRTRIGLAILIAAVTLGLLGDLLLRTTPWGLNLLLCVAALIGAGALVARACGVPIGRDTPGLALTAALLAAAYVRRASPVLQALDLGALVVALSLGAWSCQGVRVRALGLLDHLRSLVITAGRTLTGAFGLVLHEIPWSELPQRGRLAQARAVGLGLALAAPLLLVFGGLFTSADAVFANVVSSAVDLDFGATLSHLFGMGVLGVLAGGYLATALLLSPPRHPTDAPTSLRLGIVPVGTALALVNLLFLLFVVIQVRYLFGGQQLVLETTGLTLAEYARRGFFELVIASALVLPLLLGADWVLREEGAEARMIFRRLATLLLLLLVVVMASALERMRLYVDEFGLSQIRLYSTVFMVWLGVVCAWFGWTALRGARRRFAFGVLMQSTVALAALHLANPDALIARVNVARAVDGARFDAAYLVRELSADAVPTLLESLPRLAPRQACDLARRLGEHRPQGRAERDWRSWNWARARAQRAVGDRRLELKSIACRPETSRLARPST